MTLTKIADQASIGRQRLLLAAMDKTADYWEERADVYTAAGLAVPAIHARAVVLRAQRVANRARRRLAAVTVFATTEEPQGSCPLADCAWWKAPTPKPMPKLDHEVIERPGYRIHLPARPARPVWWRRWVARLLVSVLVRFQ